MVNDWSGPDLFKVIVSTLLTRHHGLTYELKRGAQVVKSVVKKWGNSAAVCIPAAVMGAIPIELDEPVEVREEAGRIVIEPAPPKRRTTSMS